MAAALAVPPALLERCRFPTVPADGRLTCALSAGPDSSALVALAVATGLDVEAVHVNHGIRADADRDERLAAGIAARFGVDFRVERVDVEPGPALEERAREARYAVLPAEVCTGHTADDRAETVLMNIGRGGGLAGAAAAMERVHRPLLALRRAETADLCRSLGLRVADDPMNHDRCHSRVAIRDVVLPALAEALGRDPVPLVNRHADHAADAWALISELAGRVDPTDCRALAESPRPLAAAAVRAWLTAELGLGGAPSTASIERVLDVARGVTRATEIEGGHRVSRSAQRLQLTAAGGGYGPTMPTEAATP